MKKLRVQVIPIGGPNTGSTRLRCLRPLALLDTAVEVLSASPYLHLDVDVLFIQKMADFDARHTARTALNAGVPILYDIDDDHTPEQAQMITLASRVLVDSPARWNHVLNTTGVAGCVVEPSIDYVDRPPVLPIAMGEGVVTYGWSQNLFAAAPAMRLLDGRTGWIGPAEAGVAAGGFGSFTPWSIETMLREIPTYAFCLCAYDDTGARRCFNRLLYPAAMGVVPIVLDRGESGGRTLLTRMNLAHLTCTTPDEVKKLITHLSTDWVEMALIRNRVYEYVWKWHSPKRYAERLLSHLMGIAKDKEG